MVRIRVLSGTNNVRFKAGPRIQDGSLSRQALITGFASGQTRANQVGLSRSTARECFWQTQRQAHTGRPVVGERLVKHDRRGLNCDAGRLEMLLRLQVLPLDTHVAIKECCTDAILDA